MAVTASFEGLVLDGARAAASAGRTYGVRNPANGELLADVAEGGVEDVDAAVAAARRAFATWRRVKPRDRARILRSFAAAIEEAHDELALTETRNAGKPIGDAAGEASLVAEVVHYYAGAVDKHYGHTIPTQAAGQLLTFREPLGVVGLITPWNFPMAIAMWKVAPALAAGNAVVLKPASLTPLTALRLGELAVAAGLPPGVLNVVPGPGATAGRRLVEHPGVDKVAFTGSTVVGAEVMRLSAAGIKRVTLELGGKSANVVFADADLEAAASSSPLSVFGNAGQDCCARSRLLVEETVADRFVELFLERTDALVVGDPESPATDVGPLISGGHRELVRGFVERGVAEGAELLRGGTAPDDERRVGSYLLPAVMTNVRSSMEICREEIFGPVASVLTFRDEQEAIRLANDTPYGLSGSIWTRDGARAMRMARALDAGVLSVNSSSSVHLEAPFGGFKRSGLGRELGMAALDHYTETKTVFIATEESAA